MAWNDDDSGGHDPWSGKKKQAGPPDLDAMMKKLKNSLLGGLGKGKKDDGAGGEGGNGNKIGVIGILLVIFAIVFIWALSGIFIVSPPERATVLRFGKYTETVGPGPHWIPRGIESRKVVNVQQVDAYSYDAEMLTKDENIVNVSISVQYRVDNIKDYLFNIVNPISSLQQATASALRQVIGHTGLDDILTTGREQIREQVAKQLKSILAMYQSGLLITEVTLQPAKPPDAVTAAFDDAIKAREDEQTYINKANAYTRKVSAQARGKSARILQEAQAFQQQIVLKAKADTAGYLALLPEFEKSPGVTRERLYLNTFESVLASTSKILIDVKGSNNLMYLPLDKIIGKRQAISLPSLKAMGTTTNVSTDTMSKISRPDRPTYSGGLY